MIVLTLTNCPISLRGDLTKWLIEINTGVFVGRVSARVRENLWKRVVDNVRQGQATMVYNTNNEQHMEFKIHQSQNEIIDFDGLKLVLKPSPARIKRLSKVRLGFSKASKMRMARKQQSYVPRENNSKLPFSYPDDYVVLDLETSGLDSTKDDIIEIGMLKVRNNAVCSRLDSLIHINADLKPIIVELTGINDAMLREEGKDLVTVMPKVLEFIGDNPIIGHNVEFDIGFLQQALGKCGLKGLSNATYDTMAMYTKVLNGKKAGRKLSDVAKNYNVATETIHRSLADCEVVKAVYDAMKSELKSKQNMES